MLDFLSEKEHSAKPLLMHGFSIGGYMYTDAVSFILEQPEKYGESVKFSIGQLRCYLYRSWAKELKIYVTFKIDEA